MLGLNVLASAGKVHPAPGHDSTDSCLMMRTSVMRAGGCEGVCVCVCEGVCVCHVCVTCVCVCEGMCVCA